MRAALSSGLLTLGCLSTLACQRNEPAPGRDAVGQTSNDKPKASAAPESNPPPPGAGEAKEQGTAATPNGSCPQGKWALEKNNLLGTMAAKLQGQVLEEKGTGVCSFGPPSEGTYTCAVGPEGYSVNFEANSGGGKIGVQVSMSGQSSAHYVSSGPGRVKITSIDTQGLKAKLVTRVLGNTLPAQDINLEFLPKTPGTELEYSCEGDTLKLRPLLEGAPKDAWVFRRAP